MARKKSTRKPSQIQQQYRKERQRIQRQTNRMRARGYEVPEDVLPPIPKRITRASVRRLKSITTAKLYDMADFVDLTTGEVVSGTEGRKIERRRSAQRAAETRRRKSERPDALKEWADEQVRKYEQGQEEQRKQFEAKQRRRDAEQKRRLQEDEEYKQQFEHSQIVKADVQGILAKLSETHPFAVAMVQSVIDTAIAQNGGDETIVYERIAEFPELTSVEELFYPNRDALHTSLFNDFANAIQGGPLTAQQSRDLGDAVERDDEFDPDEEA